jgi:predicted small secreted protein
MEKKNLAIACGASVAIGATAALILAHEAKKKRDITTKKILDNIKRDFQNEGEILASWIHEKPVDYTMFAVHMKVYKGGIVVDEDGNNITYKFIAEAHTGTIIYVSRVAEEVTEEDVVHEVTKK